MAKTVEALLKEAGVDVAAAKAALVKLDDAFAGEAGDIPQGALVAWVTEQFDYVRQREFFLALGRVWESEHAASLSAERKREREPGMTKAALLDKAKV